MIGLFLFVDGADANPRHGFTKLLESFAPPFMAPEGAVPWKAQSILPPWLCLLKPVLFYLAKQDLSTAAIKLLLLYSLIASASSS
jgi:hypothetical protein